MKTPELTIHASRRGIARVVVYAGANQTHDAGLALLQRVLPALADLDRQARSSAKDERDEK